MASTRLNELNYKGDVIEILKGLEDGAEIIKEGARSVRDGQSVEVVKIDESH